LIGLACPALAQTPQIPINVQVINDSGVPDSQVFLLLSGADVNVVHAAKAAEANPFAVSGVNKTPVGTVTNTTSTLVTAAGTSVAINAPITAVQAASSISMAFANTIYPSVVTIPVIAPGGSAKLTVGLPNGATAQTLTYDFLVPLPPGVTYTSAAVTGTCATSGMQIQISSWLILVPVGSTLPASGCTIVADVTSSTIGTYTATTSYLQTSGQTASPPQAPLTVTASTDVSMDFTPATLVVGQGNASTLTIGLPNASGAPQVLTQPFVDNLPTGIVTTTQNLGSCAGVVVTPTSITMAQGTMLPVNGCQIVVQVAAIASGGPLSALTRATGQAGPLSVTSPYTGAELPVYQFSMSSVASGNLYLSYRQPVTYPPAPTVTAQYRFQPLEFSYSNSIVSNGDLTSIDFYGIPLALSTYRPGDTSFTSPIDLVTYYTSTATLLKSFMNVNPSLMYAFLRTDGTTFDPATDTMANFARIVGPNQVAAPSSTKPIQFPPNAPPGYNGAWPPGKGSPWPYPSFADYLDSLVSSNYTFTEQDNAVISAYTFNYSGSITGNRTTGYTITLVGTTSNPVGGLAGNATVTLNLAPQSSGSGGFDFVIYGVPQNCDTLAVAGFNCTAASPTNPGNVAQIANAVYGWVQADVISALNFGYMQGALDTLNGGKGLSSMWYGLPPVPYPFGAARNTDDGYYNIWAALMYNHSDAYGFAFSDRKGRPSPDISFPVDGTLRIWILPDERLDAPIVQTSEATASSMRVSWPAVANADYYQVKWSPPYGGATATVSQPGPGVHMASYAIENLTSGTPYTIIVTAYGAGGTNAASAAVTARTTGSPPAPTGNVQANFGFNWTPPNPNAAPDLYIAGQKFGYVPPTSGTNGVYNVNQPIPLNVGLPAATPATLTVNAPACPTTNVCVALSFSSTSFAYPGSTTMTLVLSNPASAGELTLPKGQGGFSLVLPNGIGVGNASFPGCTGVAVVAPTATVPAKINIGDVQVSPTSSSCTITATLTPTAAGHYVVATPALVTDKGTGAAVSAAFVVTGGGQPNAFQVTQAITPPAVSPGVPAQLTMMLPNPTTSAQLVTLPFVDVMPAGVTVTSRSNAGTCSGVVISATQIQMPALASVPPSGCTISVAITASAPGLYINSPGMYVNEATVFPIQSLPLELKQGTQTIWAANYYLTFMGSPQSYSAGLCRPTDTCVGGGQPLTIPFDTSVAPNFLERQGPQLEITGSQTVTGPPFDPNHPPTIGVPFTPDANKQISTVVYPGLGSVQSAHQCHRSGVLQMKCP
jgi:hypothetical protein